WTMPTARSERRRVWVVPEALMAQLDSLACECQSSDWAIRVKGLIVELTDRNQPGAERLAQIIGELGQLADESCTALAGAGESPRAADVRRACHALTRRLSLWQMVADLQHGGETSRLVSIQSSRFSECLAEVSAYLASEAQGQSWRDYLLLDSLERLADQPSLVERDRLRELARRLLARLDPSKLDPRQREFLASSGPLSRLTSQLQRWATEPVDSRQLLETLEEFEQTGLPGQARLLMASAVNVEGVPLADQEAGSWLEEYYRNANVRVALTPALLRRLLPEPPPLEAPVSDSILGVPTRGWSTTRTTLDLRPVNDPHRLLLELEASGRIQANTRSTSGPATFYTRSNADYSAQKLFELDSQGLRAWPARAQADNRPRLSGVSTDFDWLPLIGPLVESIARARHAENQRLVRRVATRKVTTKIRRQVDGAIEPKLQAVNQRLHDQVLSPLSRMELDPRLVQLQSSDRGWTIRLRLAGDDQLAAHTPRPRAPSDSVASVQIHQSLVNNMSEQSGFDGASFTLPELQARLAQLLALPVETFSQTEADDIRISFAPRGAVAARFGEDRIELVLTIAELRHRRRVWQDFTVRIFYRPQSDGLTASLVRDGTIQVHGKRFGSSPQIALRGMFNRVFSQDRGMELLGPKLAVDGRLAGLGVTQFVIADGWIGLAVGPRRDDTVDRIIATGQGSPPSDAHPQARAADADGRL
ncbi:MAG: hypothetical protein WD278_16460, partial [Pirellulales bacterium]